MAGLMNEWPTTQRRIFSHADRNHRVLADIRSSNFAQGRIQAIILQRLYTAACNPGPAKSSLCGRLAVRKLSDRTRASSPLLRTGFPRHSPGKLQPRCRRNKALRKIGEAFGPSVVRCASNAFPLY
ncbi:hypothetical protein MRX96_055316 [Rhipicephalus microplus]